MKCNVARFALLEDQFLLILLCAPKITQQRISARAENKGLHACAESRNNQGRQLRIQRTDGHDKSSSQAYNGTRLNGPAALGCSPWSRARSRRVTAACFAEARPGGQRHHDRGCRSPRCHSQHPLGSGQYAACLRAPLNGIYVDTLFVTSLQGFEPERNKNPAKRSHFLNVILFSFSRPEISGNSIFFKHKS